jgi:hypothetical protein
MSSPETNPRGSATTHALDLIAVFNRQNRVTRSVCAFFTEYDLLVTPTLGQLPAPHGTLQYDNPDHSTSSWQRALFDYGPFTAVVNISGQPAVSLPLAQSKSGPPIDVQLVAPYGREDVLFQLAGQLEQAMPWRHRTPGLHLGEAIGGSRTSRHGKSLRGRRDSAGRAAGQRRLRGAASAGWGRRSSRRGSGGCRWPSSRRRRPGSARTAVPRRHRPAPHAGA